MRWLATFLMLLFAADSVAAEVNLSGPAKYIFADSKNFAAPGFDDSDWSEISPGLHPRWAEIGGAPGDDVKWDRIRFRLTAQNVLRNPALQIGVFSGGDEVWLNGVKIGATNNLSPRYPSWQIHTSRASPRVYVIPEGLLKEEENLLAIRQARFGGEQAGVLTGPFRIVEFAVATTESADRHARFLAISAVFVFLSVLIAVVVALLLVAGQWSAQMLWLFATVWCFMPSAVLGSALAAELGIVAHGLVHIYAIKLAALSTAPLLGFVARTLEIRLGALAWGLQVLSVVLFLTPPVGPPWYADIVRILISIWGFLAILSFALMLLWAARGALRRQVASLPLLMGMAAIFAGISVDFLAGGNPLAAQVGISGTDLSVIVFQFSLLVVAALSHREIARSLETAQSNVLTAQEQERRRIARDIHDGVGQWLTTIKLKLQMIRAGHGGDQTRQDMAEVVSHVDEAISDTRRIAHDLSPVMIEREGLLAAMRSHADHVAGRGGVDVHIDADETLSFNLTAQGHLYRIFQEAIANSTRHGHASKIVVSLQTKGADIRLVIEDNGVGLSDDRDFSGLGLASIKERAMLIAAEAHFSKARSGGTKLVVASAQVHKWVRRP